MRITCPRCSAHYDVPDSVMPSGGRDVQCSACGHSWYQLVARPAPPEETKPLEREEKPLNAAVFRPANALGDEVSEEEQRFRRLRAALDGHKARTEGRSFTLSDIQSASETTDQTEPLSEPPSDLPEPRVKREIDPEVEAVLRAEAEFERQARLHGPAQALEMQPELGLATPPRKKRDPASVRDRLARLQQAEKDPGLIPLTGGEETFPDPHGLGQSLLPEAPIYGSTTLPARTTSRTSLPVRAQSRDLAAIETAKGRAGFRWGFGLSMSLCLGASALYFAAPTLAGILPQQSEFFANVAETGAQVHVALATTVQDWFARFGTWMLEIAAQPPAA